MKQTRTIAWANAQIAQLERDIADLRAYIRVEMKKAADDASPAPAPQAAMWPTTTIPPAPKHHSARPPKKQFMLETIAAAETGVSTQQVIAAGRGNGFPEMAVENVSPQLSTYRKGGLLSLNGGIWKITDIGRQYLDQHEKGGAP